MKNELKLRLNQITDDVYDKYLNIIKMLLGLKVKNSVVQNSLLSKTFQLLDIELRRSSGKTTELLELAKVFRKEYKELMKKLGISDFTFNVGHFYFDGYFNYNGQWWYWNLDNLDYGNREYRTFYIRTAKGIDDYKGGGNQFLTLDTPEIFLNDIYSIIGYEGTLSGSNGCIAGYRLENVHPLSKLAGTFYFAESSDYINEIKSLDNFRHGLYKMCFKNLLVVPENEVYVFEGMPSETLFDKVNEKEFKNYSKMYIYAIEEQQWIDILVAKWAVNSGYDGIYYENYEIQDLRNFNFEKTIQRLDNYITSIGA